MVLVLKEDSGVAGISSKPDVCTSLSLARRLSLQSSKAVEHRKGLYMALVVECSLTMSTLKPESSLLELSSQIQNAAFLHVPQDLLPTYMEPG